jgi:Holliday junction resolvase
MGSQERPQNRTGVGAMDAAAFLLLRQLQQSPIGSDFGKICQSLLALTLRENGFNHVVNRLVEGVDIDASGDSGQFAIEVKTTESREVLIGEKDVKGWKERSRDHYAPVLAALRISLLSERTLCDATDLEKGTYRIQRLRLHEIPPLTKLVTSNFDAAVQKHVPSLLSLTDRSPLDHLKALLRKAGVDAQE